MACLLQIYYCDYLTYLLKTELHFIAPRQVKTCIRRTIEGLGGFPRKWQVHKGDVEDWGSNFGSESALRVSVFYLKSQEIQHKTVNVCAVKRCVSVFI